jgi:hypothetical protein
MQSYMLHPLALTSGLPCGKVKCSHLLAQVAIAHKTITLHALPLLRAVRLRVQAEWIGAFGALS